MDDDDEFLYGSSSQPVAKPAPQPISYERVSSQNGVVAQLEAKAEDTAGSSGRNTPEEAEEEIDLGEESEEEEDVEFIMEPTSRSIDFRQNAGRPSAQRTTSTSVPAQPKAAATQLSLTTEYTLIQRGAPPGQHVSQAQPQPQITPPTVVSQASQQIPQPLEDVTQKEEALVELSTLPPVKAPPSYPAIDPSATGVLDGRSILEVDIAAMTEKPWRRPGSDISDWFNYGFDEISWEAYCYRRRELGDLANVLKTNVINFAAMTEDQLTALPPEARQMVLTGATAMMNGAAANTGMIGPGVMMDMTGMMAPMGMGIGMGLGGDMGMPGAMMPMPDGTSVQQNVGVANGTQEQVSGNVGMMQDGFSGPAPGGMMNMGMGGPDFGMQQEQNPMSQQMYPEMTAPPSIPQGPSAGRGASPAPYRGRAMAMNRGRAFPMRGRGRGMYGEGGPPPAPVRPASPLPPGVPTGPRNQNKYKDRDVNAPAVEGLDYGGTMKDMGGRTPSGEPEDRVSRKRRSSPGLDDRSSKRR